MSTVSLRRVKICGKDTFAGASVLLLLSTERLSDEQLLAFGREGMADYVTVLNRSERADFVLRFFDTKQELRFVDLACIAACQVISDEGLYGTYFDGAYQFKIETIAGIKEYSIIKQADNLGNKNIEIAYKAEPCFLQSPKQINYIELLQALCLEANLVDDKLNLLQDTESHVLFVPIRNLYCLKSIEYDYDALKVFSKQYKISALVLFSLEALDSNNHCHFRFFAPLGGVQESPLNLRAGLSLTKYIIENKLYRFDSDILRLVFEQGDFIQKPSRFQVEVNQGQELIETFVIVTARTVMKSKYVL